MKGILPSHKKEENNANCSNMDATRNYHTKWRKSERERQTPYDIMWNIYHIIYVESKTWHGLPLWLNGKESACNAGNPGSILGSGRSPGEGNGNLLQYSCWRIPWTEELGGVQSMGLQRVRHNWVTNTATNELYWVTPHLWTKYKKGLSCYTSFCNCVIKVNNFLK